MHEIGSVDYMYSDSYLREKESKRAETWCALSDQIGEKLKDQENS